MRIDKDARGLNNNITTENYCHTHTSNLQINAGTLWL